MLGQSNYGLKETLISQNWKVMKSSDWTVVKSRENSELLIHETLFETKASLICRQMSVCNNTYNFDQVGRRQGGRQRVSVGRGPYSVGRAHRSHHGGTHQAGEGVTAGHAQRQRRGSPLSRFTGHHGGLETAIGGRTHDEQGRVFPLCTLQDTE